MAALAKQGAANPELRKLASEVAASDSDPIGAWDFFVRTHFVYREEDREVVRTVPFMLEEFREFRRFEGDCDCISTFNAAALSALGFPSRFVAIRTEEDSPEFLHVYAEAFDGESWRRLDPTVLPSMVDDEISYAQIIQPIG